MKAPCEKYSQAKEDLDKEFKQNETLSDKELYLYLSNHTGQDISSIHDLESLNSILSIEVSIQILFTLNVY